MNLQQALFILLVALVTLGLIVISVIYFSNPPSTIQTLNDCTREIVGNCTVIR